MKTNRWVGTLSPWEAITNTAEGACETSVAVCQLNAVVHKPQYGKSRLAAPSRHLAQAAGEPGYLIWQTSEVYQFISGLSICEQKKKKRRSDVSQSPKARSQPPPHAPGEGLKVPQLDHLCWFDPVSSQARNLLQRDPASKKLRRILLWPRLFCGHTVTWAPWRAASVEEASVWGTQRAN